MCLKMSCLQWYIAVYQFLEQNFKLSLKKSTILARYNANRNGWLYLIQTNKRVTRTFQPHAVLTSVKSVFAVNGLNKTCCRNIC